MTRTVRVGRDAIAQMTGGPEAETTFYGHDILGSVTARFSDRGQRVDDLEYRAFGELRQGAITPENPYGYTGKPMDPTTGIYDYGFRDYAPELARFTTVDPIKDGNNWYAYVGNDPVNFVDPLGLARAAGTGTPIVPTVNHSPTSWEQDAGIAAFGAAGTLASAATAVLSGVTQALIASGTSYGSAVLLGTGAAAPLIGLAGIAGFVGYDLLEGSGLDQTNRGVSGMVTWIRGKL